MHAGNTYIIILYDIESRGGRQQRRRAAMIIIVVVTVVLIGGQQKEDDTNSNNGNKNRSSNGGCGRAGERATEHRAPRAVRADIQLLLFRRAAQYCVRFLRYDLARVPISSRGFRRISPACVISRNKTAGDKRNPNGGGGGGVLDKIQRFRVSPRRRV